MTTEDEARELCERLEILAEMDGLDCFTGPPQLELWIAKARAAMRQSIDLIESFPAPTTSELLVGPKLVVEPAEAMQITLPHLTWTALPGGARAYNHQDEDAYISYEPAPESTLAPGPEGAAVAALKRLTFAAETSGGTAGRDEELCAAIAEAKDVLASPIAAPTACPYGCSTQEEHDAHQADIAAPTAERPWMYTFTPGEAARRFDCAAQYFGNTLSAIRSVFIERNEWLSIVSPIAKQLRIHCSNCGIAVDAAGGCSECKPSKIFRPDSFAPPPPNLDNVSEGEQRYAEAPSNARINRWLGWLDRLEAPGMYEDRLGGLRAYVESLATDNARLREENAQFKCDHSFHRQMSQTLGGSVRCETCGGIVTAEVVLNSECVRLREELAEAKADARLQRDYGNTMREKHDDLASMYEGARTALAASNRTQAEMLAKVRELAGKWGIRAPNAFYPGRSADIANAINLCVADLLAAFPEIAEKGK